MTVDTSRFIEGPTVVRARDSEKAKAPSESPLWQGPGGAPAFRQRLDQEGAVERKELRDADVVPEQSGVCNALRGGICAEG